MFKKIIFTIHFMANKYGHKIATEKKKFESLLN